MAKIRVRMNSAGARQLLNDPKVTASMRARAERIKAALPTSNGEQWAIRPSKTDRMGFVVVAVNYEARAAAADGALVRAMNAGR